jgi:acetylglutamate kinase
MIVIKYGGHALPTTGGVDSALELIASEFKNGRKFVLVHGGGPQINTELERHKIQVEMIDGVRKTSPEVLKVVQKVLSGEVLRLIVNQLIALGVNAVGISSGDGELVRAKKQSGNLGEVGEIVSTNPKVLSLLLENGYLPVISPVGVGVNGESLNLNADTVAGAIGGAIGAEKVLFMTDVAGIYENWPDQSSLLKNISAEALRSKLKKFSGGIVPKVEALLNAVDSGANSAMVFDGRDSNILKEAIESQAGTLVLP